MAHNANRPDPISRPNHTAPANPRMTAYRVLMQVDGEGGYSNIALNAALSGTSLAPRDKAFVTRLVYGVLEHEEYLDHVIGSYVRNGGGGKIEPAVRCLLRMAVYQMAFLDTPDAAAVNESVNLAKKLKLFRATGFINGLLRHYIRDGKQVKLPDPHRQPDRYLSVTYSCPLWLVKLWREAYGDALCEGILSRLTERPPLFARVNTTRVSTETLQRALAECGVNAEPSAVLPDCLLLSHTGAIQETPPYLRGEFHVQDGSSQLCCLLAAPSPGDTVYDVCAAPGGKSFTIAERMGNVGKVISCDIHPHRVALIAEGAERLVLDCIQPTVRDALSDDGEAGCADLVLCDVPCSGLGIIRRKPDIKRKPWSEIQDLPALQYDILTHAARLVKPGGRLVYSTCTLRPAENGGVVERFLKGCPDFEPCAMTLPSGWKRLIQEPAHMLTVFPQTADTDGFFIATVRRRTN
ncbi:MAG: 16S rRNA (cytosine(967)-C(5))-methyltransferase RsmB [Clostridia bacterium]|nr:16S rRNA (cytosine(967)-C(5))-methyltransferase RsmB [Clostridia bacterium]